MRKILSTLILTTIISAMVAGCLTSCSTSRNVNKNNEKTDSTVTTSLSDSVRVLKSEVARLTQENRELQYFGVVFDSTLCPTCPEIQMPDNCTDTTLRETIDELNKQIRRLNEINTGLQNSVTIAADGSKEVKGRIKVVTYSNDKLEKSTIELKRENDSLRAVKQNTIVKTVTIKETKTVKSKMGFLTQWWVWLLFLLLGMWLRGKLSFLDDIKFFGTNK